MDQELAQSLSTIQAERVKEFESQGYVVMMDYSSPKTILLANGLDRVRVLPDGWSDKYNILE